MPTYDYECPKGHRFEVIGAPVGTESWCCRIRGCGRPARRIFEPGSWTVHGTGVMEERYIPAIGKSVGSRRKLDQEMKAIGAVPKGSTPRRTPPVINEIQIETARKNLIARRVEQFKEWRLKADYEERNGRKAPPPP